jgi:putative ubiquitin-RnfH superfamily antitoxin RatB of RatAB toxin-antitoxin module
MVDIELVYVPLNQKAIYLSLSLPVGATVDDAIKQSGWLQTHPEIINYSIGIFGTPVPLTRALKARDRIEIYRPLLIDPKEKRRERARRT